jgi:hypothetical protein
MTSETVKELISGSISVQLVNDCSNSQLALNSVTRETLREEVSAVNEQWHCCKVTGGETTELNSIMWFQTVRQKLLQIFINVSV